MEVPCKSLTWLTMLHKEMKSLIPINCFSTEETGNPLEFKLHIGFNRSLKGKKATEDYFKAWAQANFCSIQLKIHPSKRWIDAKITVRQRDELLDIHPLNIDRWHKLDPRGKTQ